MADRAQARALLATLPQLSWQLMPVSNRVGQGSVPVGELTRRFVDQAGRLHQALALQCEPVVLVWQVCRWF
ncbi:adenosyl cobinamide kinase/adenosyl cobinamide phosphate guanylyltransferase [Xanthomonas campestris]